MYWAMLMSAALYKSSTLAVPPRPKLPCCTLPFAFGVLIVRTMRIRPNGVNQALRASSVSLTTLNLHISDFLVAVCTLSSRHVDDPRVRANPTDPSTAGKQYFELFKRLRDLPSADRPTLYSIQAAFLAAIFAFGLGNLSKAFALQAESVTLCLDGGLHRSVDDYDHFNVIEKETRKVGVL